MAKRTRKNGLPANRRHVVALTETYVRMNGREFRLRQSRMSAPRRARLRNEIREVVEAYGLSGIRAVLNALAGRVSVESDEYDGMADELDRLASDHELPKADRRRYAAAYEYLAGEHDLLDTAAEHLENATISLDNLTDEVADRRRFGPRESKFGR